MVKRRGVVDIDLAGDLLIRYNMKLRFYWRNFIVLWRLNKGKS